MPNIQGAVERIGGNTILGWARAFGTVERMSCEAYLDGQAIGSADQQEYRPDLGGAFGFRIRCSAPISILDVVTKRLRVEARTSDGCADLQVLPAATSGQLGELITQVMKQYSKEDIGKILDVIGQLPALQSVGNRPAVTDIGARQKASTILNSLPPRIAGACGLAQVSRVPVPVGCISSDGAAVLGTNGEAYLIGGNNSVLEQFLASPEHPSTLSTAVKWRDAINCRVERLRALNVKFLQIIIPEKLSIYPDDFPFELKVPSAPLRALERVLAPDAVLKDVLIWNSHEVEKEVLPREVFGRIDTHLTTKGAYTLFCAILARLGYPSPFGLELGRGAVLVGDLAERFFGVPLPETYEFPTSDFEAKLSAGLRILEKDIPPDGHTGTRIVWRNDQAPLNIRVVTFANSFFERGGSARTLSWWFSRAVREFHFIWSADLDFDYVGRNRPDWVFCQTVERFLSRVPQDINMEAKTT